MSISSVAASATVALAQQIQDLVKGGNSTQPDPTQQTVQTNHDHHHGGGGTAPTQAEGTVQATTSPSATSVLNTIA
jgi:hypothetical protein